MYYSSLVELYRAIQSTAKRLEKTFLIAEFLKKTPAEELPFVLLQIQGRVFPPWDQRVIGIASRTVIAAIRSATGRTENDVQKEWKKIGDLGEVARKLCEKKQQSTLFSQRLTLKKVV